MTPIPYIFIFLCFQDYIKRHNHRHKTLNVFHSKIMKKAIKEYKSNRIKYVQRSEAKRPLKYT